MIPKRKSVHYKFKILSVFFLSCPRWHETFLFCLGGWLLIFTLGKLIALDLSFRWISAVTGCRNWLMKFLEKVTLRFGWQNFLSPYVLICIMCYSWFRVLDLTYFQLLDSKEDRLEGWNQHASKAQLKQGQHAHNLPSQLPLRADQPSCTGEKAVKVCLAVEPLTWNHSQIFFCFLIDGTRTSLTNYQL